jgi:hypothetical protein
LQRKPPLKRAAMQLFFKKIYDFFMLWIFLQRKPPLKRAAMQLFFKKIYDFFMLWIFLIFFMLFLSPPL